MISTSHHISGQKKIYGQSIDPNPSAKLTNSSAERPGTHGANPGAQPENTAPWNARPSVELIRLLYLSRTKRWKPVGLHPHPRQNPWAPPTSRFWLHPWKCWAQHLKDLATHLHLGSPDKIQAPSLQRLGLHTWAPPWKNAGSPWNDFGSIFKTQSIRNVCVYHSAQNELPKETYS